MNFRSGVFRQNVSGGISPWRSQWEALKNWRLSAPWREPLVQCLQAAVVDVQGHEVVPPGQGSWRDVGEGLGGAVDELSAGGYCRERRVVFPVAQELVVPGEDQEVGVMEVT